MPVNLLIDHMSNHDDSEAVESKSCVFVMQGATLVDRIVTITPAENYVLNREIQVFPLSHYSNLFSTDFAKYFCS